MTSPNPTLPTTPATPTTPPAPATQFAAPPADPTQLGAWAQAAAAEISRLRSENADRRVAARRETVSRHAAQVAAGAGVNPDALLGSVDWQQRAEQLDPASPQFREQLSAAITASAATNPWIKTGQATTAPAQPAAPPARSGGAPPQPATTPGPIQALPLDAAVKATMGAQTPRG